MIENERLGLGERVQIVGLEKSRLAGDWFEQEIDQRGFFAPGEFAETALKLLRIRPVIGRQAHAGEQDLGAGSLGGVDHGRQIVAHLADRQAAQTVVGAERDDDDGRLVLAQGGSEPGASAGRGFAGDRQVGNVIIKMFVAQALGEQGWPGLLRANAVAGRQRIAEDQNGFAGPTRGGGAEQNTEKEDKPHGR